MSFLDALFDLGTMFDWISPTKAMVQDLANGPNHTFMIPQNCGWTGGEIAALLQRAGVKTWGHMIINGYIMITVRESDYWLASCLLDEVGLGG